MRRLFTKDEARRIAANIANVTGAIAKRLKQSPGVRRGSLGGYQARVTSTSPDASPIPSKGDTNGDAIPSGGAIPSGDAIPSGGANGDASNDDANTPE